MTRRLFLEGPSGIGKTTLLLDELGPLRRRAGGFVSLRLLDAKGSTRAFALAPPFFASRSVLPYSQDIPNVFLEHGNAEGAWHAEVFERAAMTFLADAEERALLLLDEIGGCELLLDSFRTRLRELLNAPSVPCIGVLKSVANAERMAQRVPLPREYLQRYRAFREHLTDNALLLSLSEANREAVVQSVRDFLSPLHGEGQA